MKLNLEGVLTFIENKITEQLLDEYSISEKFVGVEPIGWPLSDNILRIT